MAKIPLVDLTAQYFAYKDEFDEAIQRCIVSNNFIGGSDYNKFAQEFAKFCGGGHIALCGNGTDALHLTLIELLGQGDGSGEVITVSHSFIATAEVISNAGYIPRFVDVNPKTCLMDVTSIEQAITSKTKAIMPVHLYGQMVPMDQLMEIANRYNLPVIEDAAQAHGATWLGKGPGHWGDVACFSFYPSKNLGAWGDGGAVYSRDRETIEHIQMRANHGRQVKTKYEHEIIGINSRMDGLQAAVLRVKLRHLAEWNKKRRQIAAWYNEHLEEMKDVQLLTVNDKATPVYHLYVVLLDERDRILENLHAKGVRVGIHYPIPIHEQLAYKHLGLLPHSLPGTHDVSRRVLSLPIFPEMTHDQVREVVQLIKKEIFRGDKKDG